MEDNTNTMVAPYNLFNPITKKSYKFRKEYKSVMQLTPPSQMHRSLLRHIFWFVRLDYTVKNSNLGIAIQNQKQYGLTFVSTFLKLTRM